MRRFTLLLSLAAALLVAACSDGGAEEVLSGFERTPTPSVGDATITNVTDGDPFRFAAETDGGLLLVYFGFTNCPDICPTTLADTRAAIDSLPDDEAARIGTAMVTVDPERDTVEILPGYVRSFLPDAVALRGTNDAELRRVADAFGVTYEVVPAEEAASGNIEVIHTGSLYAVGSNGDLLISWPFGVTPEDLAKDLRILLAREAT